MYVLYIYVRMYKFMQLCTLQGRGPRVCKLVLGKMFKVAIITSSFCFAGIIRHSIILRYLLAVLRILCAL